MPETTILLVDDDDLIRVTLGKLLEEYGYSVTTAAGVSEALHHIGTDKFDVLLTDLHMPGLGDGLTVVSAMRHSNPKAVTMVLSAFPEMDAAAREILTHADQVLVKPMEVTALIKAMELRLLAGPPTVRTIESVAAILKRSVQSTIKEWYALIVADEKITIPLTFEQRTGHLPGVFYDLVSRLESNAPIGTRERVSAAAREHGINRRRQGYTAAMMVEESRMLQVSLFNTLQKNLATIDFSVVLVSIMTIADEIDSQLSQAMDSYILESIEDDRVIQA